MWIISSLLLLAGVLVQEGVYLIITLAALNRCRPEDVPAVLRAANGHRSPLGRALSRKQPHDG